MFRHCPFSQNSQSCSPTGVCPFWSAVSQVFELTVRSLPLSFLVLASLIIIILPIYFAHWNALHSYVSMHGPYYLSILLRSLFFISWAFAIFINSLRMPSKYSRLEVQRDKLVKNNEHSVIDDKE